MRSKIMPATRRSQELSTMLRQKVAGIADGVGRLAEERVVMPPDEVIGLYRKLREVARDAEQIGKAPAAKGERFENPRVRASIRILVRVESQVAVLREMLLDGLFDDEIDPKGRHAQRVATIIAELEQVSGMFAGRGERQS